MSLAKSSTTFNYSRLAAAVLAATALNIQADEAKQIETIEVTATKKTTNIQETPVTVDAMSAEDLKDQNIGNFDDFARYMPNVTLGGRGPGQNDVFIRGMAIQPITVMLSGAQGTMPNVALYLDEHPVTAPGRNLDIYATDLARIEVLPGPQGTLYGASSQAGTVRYITNKPRLDGFAAGFTSRLEDTAHGEMSTSTEGFINLPLSADTAVRVAMYSVQRGGYIDNVAGEFNLDPAALVANTPYDAGLDGASYQAANNVDLVEDDFNDSRYRGARLGVLTQLTDDWQLLVQHTMQTLEADGVFDYDPAVGDLQVERYYPDALEDEVNITSWSLEGTVDDLELVYTGSFLDRTIDQSIDYTGYNNSGAYIPWYTCTYDSPRVCLDPTKGFQGYQEHQRTTHEFRVSTELSEQLSITAGVYLDDFELQTQDDYHYVAISELGFVPNAPISTAVQVNPETRPAGIAFFNDIIRSEEQIAVFAEASYALTDHLDVIAGLRWYDMESDFAGSSNFAEMGVDGDSGRDYDVSGGHTDEPMQADDVITKFGLSYNTHQDALFYATYSEGFRPGGFNRGGGIQSINPEFPNVSVTYETDNVKNYEFGWKTMLADRSLRFNGNIYFIDWTNMQTSRFDPTNVSILTFIENAADAEISGLETDLEWLATDNLTIMAAFSFNQTELTAVYGEAVEMSPVGSALPLTPETQGNIRARYDWQQGQYDLNWQIGYQFASSAYSSIVAEEREKQDSYGILNASLNAEKDSWSATFYVDNVTDERAQLFINNMDDIRRISTNRPRTMGLRISYAYY